MLLDGIDNNINEYTDSGKAGYGSKLFSFWQRVNNSDHLSRSWYWAEGYCICLDCNWMNSIQGGSGPIKKPASAGFNVIGSRDSVAYPFLSPHRLVGVLLRLITSCFCWCSPYTVQSWLVGWRSLNWFFNLLLYMYFYPIQFSLGAIMGAIKLMLYGSSTMMLAEKW